MSSFIERRRPVSQTAFTLAVMFGVAALVAIVFDVVPAWQKHGADAGPKFIRRAADPDIYFWLTAFYAVVAAGAMLLAFFRFPWVTISHIRLLFLAVFLFLGGLLIYQVSGLK